MSRPALLAAYEKLVALLGKLPGSLQEPILRELDPIKEIFLRQRAPRLAILGAENLELPALVNALAGRPVLHAPLTRGSWTQVRGSGTVELADIRGMGAHSGAPPDLFIYVASGASESEARRAAEVLASAAPREGGSPAGLAVLVLGGAGDIAPVLSALAAAGASSSVVFSAHLPRGAAEQGISPSERSDLGDRLCDFLPEDAQLELARFLHARGAQARLAGTVLKAFGAVAGVIGMQPIPLADFPILLSLQIFMVSLIIYTSGREFSLRLAGEFAASLGIGFGAGLVFRETARAAVKILPVWGNMISGGVAGAGTYALGRAAIAYYIEGRHPGRLPWFGAPRDFARASATSALKMSSEALRSDRLWLGTCAWSFEDWRDVFYPHDLPRNRWLQYYARHFHAVEMDSSFYHLPSALTVSHWEELAGPGFRFCPKLPKTLSHEKRLEDPAPEIAMMRRLAAELGPYLGCALLQLPPSFHARSHEEKILRAFLRAWPDVIPLAVEFRHESWETPHAAGILQDSNVAWVWADNFALDEEKKSGFGFSPVTASHLYVRLLGDFRTKYGPDGKETHRYGKLLWPRNTSLAHWVAKLRHHADADAIYLFANNHYEGMAVETVSRLAGLLGVGMPRPSDSGAAQLDLFDSAGAG